MQEQTWGKCHCTSCCWYYVWLRGVGGVGGEVSGEVSGETKPSKHIHILIALFITRIQKEFKQVSPYQPTSGKPSPT